VAIKATACAEKGRLFDDYKEAGSELFAAASALGSKTGAELEKALAVSAAARVKCDVARLALRQHKDQHGC